MNLWTGTLARLGTPAADGRRLAHPERLRAEPLPLPLTNLEGQLIGSITQLSIRADRLIAEGTIRNGILTPGQPLPAGLDVDDLTPHPDDPSHYTDWRVRRAAADARLTPAFPDAHIRLKEPA